MLPMLMVEIETTATTLLPGAKVTDTVVVRELDVSRNAVPVPKVIWAQPCAARARNRSAFIYYGPALNAAIATPICSAAWPVAVTVGLIAAAVDCTKYHIAIAFWAPPELFCRYSKLNPELAA